MEYHISDFQKLLEEHTAANHLLFSYLEEKNKKELSANEYQAFAINYIARTIFTIPEVAAATYRSSVDLRMKGVSFGSMTLNEEGGEGKPENNHANLLVKAINYHGKAVYGDKYKDVDHEKIMKLFRLMHDSANVASINQLDAVLDKSKFISNLIKEKNDNIEASQHLLTNHTSKVIEETFGRSLSQEENKHYTTALKAGLELMSMGICKEVISYGTQQLKVMDSEVKGKLAGCAYAHEGLADNMMLHVFKLMYSQAKKYKGGEEEFDKEVYPYFSAHGDYKAMAKGKIAVNSGEGVEAEHARREVAKIEEVLGMGKEYAQNAYNGAKEFADRQNLVWDGIMEKMKEIVLTKSIFQK